MYASILPDCEAVLLLRNKKKKKSLYNNELKQFKLTDYRQHSIGEGSATRSATYIRLMNNNGKNRYGCGIDSSIEKSGLLALISAINRLP